MKKIIYIFIVLFTINIGFFQVEADSNKTVLTIYNVEDYISSGGDGYVDIIQKFEDEYNVKVNYYTYDTNETMYNQFMLQKEGTYDLICTSDYMIQKLIKENLVIPMDDFDENIPNYERYASKTLRKKLENMTVNYQNKTVNLDEFAVGYMWGTLGIVYDPLYTKTICEDVKSWDIFWDEQYHGVISIKNSIRDAFVVGLMHSYSKSNEFKEKQNAYLNNPTKENQDAYQQLIQEIFDFKLDGSDASDAENKEKIENVKNELITMKDNIFGFEVDSGKNDIITGKIKMNLAYSGDAVYSIDTAFEEANKRLEYYVPEDGSNIWYDAWVLPKGSNKELAYKFLNFLSDPANAAANMDYIGYTPYIVGDELFTLTGVWYGACDYSVNCEYNAEDEALVIYENKLYRNIKDKPAIKDMDEPTKIYPDNPEYFESLEFDENCEYFEDDMISYNGKIYYCTYQDDETGYIGKFDTQYFSEVEEYDISYLFEGSLTKGRRAIIYPYKGYENKLSTQYPTKEIISRCAIMNDFGDYNDKVVIMWGQVKAYTNMIFVYVFLITFLLICILFTVIYFLRNHLNNKYKKL